MIPRQRQPKNRPPRLVPHPPCSSSRQLGLRRLILPGFSGLVILVLGGCMGGPIGPGMHGRGAGNDAQAPSPLSGASELLVVADDFSFEPDELRIRAGETVNLTLDNRGGLYHDLSIEDNGFVLTADAGERASGALTVPAAGRYRFVCSVPGHAEAGMTGTLVAEEGG